MISINLPRLGGTRDDADLLLKELGLPEAAPTGELVALFGRDVIATSSSFADQLVKRLLEERPDLSVVLVSTPTRLQDNMERAGERRGVGSDRLTVSSASALGA